MGNQQQSSPLSFARVDVDVQGDVNIITIRAGEVLDMHASELFTSAIAQAQHNVGSIIFVDLASTRRISDSGVALLLMLDERSWRSASKVRIINCNHELVHRITHCLPPGEFNLSGDCGELETLQ